jgi:GxxExxY protein
MKHKELTGQIIECAYKVHNHLGFGFLESVYQNALLIELEKAGLKAKMEVPINVFYDCTKKTSVLSVKSVPKKWR